MSDSSSALPRIQNGSIADIPDAKLLERAVTSARDRQRRGYHTRLEAVMWCFTLGSTYAAQLCRRFNLDPDEKVK